MQAGWATQVPVPDDASRALLSWLWLPLPLYL